MEMKRDGFLCESLHPAFAVFSLITSFLKADKLLNPSVLLSYLLYKVYTFSKLYLIDLFKVITDVNKKRNMSQPRYRSRIAVYANAAYNSTKLSIPQK